MTEKLELDAIHEYLLKQVSPQARLDYFELSHVEKAILRAMCSYSRDGIHLSKSLQAIASRARVHRDTVRRFLNGHTKHGVKVRGSKDRGLITETAPAKKREMKPAVLRINWEAFAIDPRMFGILEKQMQMNLPGMGRPSELPGEEMAAAEEVPVNLLSKSSRKGVEKAGVMPAPSPHAAGTLPILCGYPPDPVRGEDLSSYIDHSSKHIRSSPSQKSYTAVQKAVFQKPIPKESAWKALHPGLMRKLCDQLELLAEAHAGRNQYGWTPQQIAEEERRIVLVACAQMKPAIWTHVAQQLAQEEYEAVLERELAKQKQSDLPPSGGNA